MFHFFKNTKIKQFDDALEQYNKEYETFIVSSSSVSTLTNCFKLDIVKGYISDTCGYISDTCQSYTRSARSSIQKLKDLHANVSKLEPQTQEHVIQRENLRIEINEQLINLHEFIDWVLIVKSAYNQGRLDGSHKAEEKPMD